MEFIVELILEILFEGGEYAVTSNKVPKSIRYIILVFLIIICLVVVALLYFVAYLALKLSVLAAILLFIIASSLLVSMIIKFRNEYLIKLSEVNNEL